MAWSSIQENDPTQDRKHTQDRVTCEYMARRCLYPPNPSRCSDKLLARTGWFSKTKTKDRSHVIQCNNSTLHKSHTVNPLGTSPSDDDDDDGDEAHTSVPDAALAACFPDI